ncbi:hypothetical protein SAMN04487768_2083 [Burkholderia sp. b13]|nr:hypothetical protein SAMN04487768_2083 [Burkholderia sp. b13]
MRHRTDEHGDHSQFRIIVPAGLQVLRPALAASLLSSRGRSAAGGVRSFHDKVIRVVVACPYPLLRLPRASHWRHPFERPGGIQ